MQNQVRSTNWHSAIDRSIAIKVARCPVINRPGRYFTANLAEAGEIEKPVFSKPVPEAGILKINDLQ